MLDPSSWRGCRMGIWTICGARRRRCSRWARRPLCAWRGWRSRRTGGRTRPILPSYLRGDSVHQVDLDRVKCVYHINVVDDVTQCQFAGSAERISQRYLLPMLEVFPCRIQRVRSDDGSEYVNIRLAGSLEKLRGEEFTPPRSRRSNDQAWNPYYACSVLSALPVTIAAYPD